MTRIRRVSRRTTVGVALGLVAAGLVLVVLLAPASPAALAPSGPAGSTPAQSPQVSGTPGTALAALAGLTVKGRAPKTGYRRDLFGEGWTQTHPACTTRDDILRRDLRLTTFGAGGCQVLSGVLTDPYTGRRVSFQRGRTTSAEVQIDHLVALSDAWQKGAQQWSAAKRVAFANDPLELLATEAAVNAAKSDSDAASWLPPAKAFRCAFVARQISVKARYGVWVTSAERQAMARVLAACPQQPTLGLGAPPVRAESSPRSRPASR